jgi:tetratricopeptide (TPR) repeat protein
MIEEATKESLRQSFTEAGRKFIEAAETSERRGDYEGADKLYRQAADAYEKAADKYRTGKGFKNSALNMCAAGDVYSELGESQKAVESYGHAAEDLFAAAGEHLLWGEDAETAKGTALAMAACMILLMIGREADSFYRARTFSAENASKLRFPAIVRLSQIPQMIETSIQAMDLDGFATAETAAVTELKAALANANAQEFTKYVDKGLDMVREILRGKLKVPRLVPQLALPNDMTFSEEFPIRVLIQNAGDGEATNLNLEWHIDEDLVVMSGEQKKSIPMLPPGESLDIAVVVKAKEGIMGVKEYTIMMKGVYSDKLKTEYSLQAGPGTLVLKDFKETEKLQQALDVTDTRLGLLTSTVEDSPFEKEVLHGVVSSIGNSVRQARTYLEEGDIPSARGCVHVVNEMVDKIDAILGDEELIARINEAKEAKRRSYAKVMLQSAKEEIDSTLKGKQAKIEAASLEAKVEWGNDAESKKGLAALISAARDKASDLMGDLEVLKSELPSAADSVDPTEGALRTKNRTMVETAVSKLSGIRAELERMSSDKVLAVGVAPDTPEKVALAKKLVDELISDIGAILESKKTETG